MSKWRNHYNDARHYKKEWEETFKWLCYIDNCCYCRWCKCSLSNMRKSGLEQHEKTSKHKKAVASFSASRKITDSFKKETVKLLASVSKHDTYSNLTEVTYNAAPSLTDLPFISEMDDTCALKDKEREFMVDFIDIYRKHLALWKTKSKEYCNRNLRNKGIDELHEKLKELDPQCTRNDVMKKINCLRKSFRRELQKHESSKKSVKSTDEIYTPTLWYFEDMMFICDQDVPRESISSLHSVDEESVVKLPDDDEVPSCSDTPAVKQSHRNTTQSDHILNLVARNLEKGFERRDSANETFGKYVGQRLESLDIKIASIARKLITDVLFEAENGNLTASSKIAMELYNLPESFAAPVQ